MKKYIILLSALCTVALSGCYKEDPIKAPLEKYWRDYDVNSTDPTLKYVSEYWAKYDKVLLYDAEPRDYVYNFQQKNDVEITKPTDNIYAKLQLFDQLFMQKYSDDVKKEVFPFNMIIAEEILYTGGMSPSKPDFYGSRSFAAFKITDADLAADAAGLKAKSASMHKSFILNYCIGQEKASLKKFGSVSTYGSSFYIWKDKDCGKDIAYEYGFLYVQAWQSFWPDDPKNPWRHSFRSSVDNDANDYFDLIINSTDQELADLCAKWPLVNKKIGYFIEMLESLGINYKDLK